VAILSERLRQNSPYYHIFLVNFTFQICAIFQVEDHLLGSCSTIVYRVHNTGVIITGATVQYRWIIPSRWPPQIFFKPTNLQVG